MFIIPGVIVMAGLAMLYTAATCLTWFAALFLGIKAAVVAIVAQALLRIAARALTTRFKRVVAAFAFFALFLFALPFPLAVLGAGLIGAAVAHWRPHWLALPTSDVPASLPPPRHGHDAQRPWHYGW
ncbi:MAG: chromate transporter [Sphingopyxis sp.]